MKISEISLYFNGLRFHLSILPKSNYLPLCCFTGLPYCDIYTLTADDIKIGVDGKKWIMKDRGKTGVESFIPLLQIPLDILAKYEGKLKDGRLLPVISNQKMNEYLAEIAAICQINKRITYHLARHSFATEICLTKGVPIESVSKMLGHTNIQTTQIYARVVDRKLSHDMNMLDRKLKSMQKGTAQNAV
ncbi:site-specific integrase [uncultured Bacteroides sp.]|uniref:site-specific integrase n=1 Tax=uncultured Bacteroides sp. TaxID=162156 RepID=UPI002623E84D|nr:site-specific integrase [uncultured Bacteroides sp.]